MRGIFKPIFAALLLLAPSLTPAAQEPPARLISVPVRVFDGSRFVGALALADFELQENGAAQALVALDLVEKDAVTRHEGGEDFRPFLGRRFTLLFQLFEYHPKLAEAIRYLFDQELRPGDTLEIQTPARNYILSAKAFASQSKKVLADRMIEIVRRDIGEGGVAYNNLMTELKKHVRAIGGANPMESLEQDTETEGISLEMLLPRYRQILLNLDALRRIDGDKLVRFARALKSQPGRKFVFYIYQREYRPEISPQVISELQSNNQDNTTVLADLQELFLTYQQSFAADIPRIKEAFADSAAQFNLLFMNKSPERIARIVMREQSEDTFRAFSDIAGATGGIVDTSQNPAAAVKAGLHASERYYLLYYRTTNPARDGAFRPIRVRVKGRDYSVLSRQGYIAD